ncbi:MAG: DUF3494 domain-containing protein, partial [Acidobacteria bacterium]|nr:DUF3494 domain-containing protein [Acidobacteriota bacterium]
MKIKEPNTFLFRGNKRTLYFMTLFALLALGAAAYLTVPTFNSGSTVAAQQSEQQPDLPVGVRSRGEHATAQMISYALSNRTGNLSDSISALNQLPCHDVTETELSGRSFAPGVYCLSSARLAGEMILNGGGDPNAVFIFNVAGTLETMEDSRISLADGAQSSHVYFVADTANVGTGSDFRAAILAKNSINLNANVRVAGKVASLSGEISGANSSPDGGGTGTLEICKAVTGSTVGDLRNRV